MRRWRGAPSVFHGSIGPAQESECIFDIGARGAAHGTPCKTGGLDELEFMKVVLLRGASGSSKFSLIDRTSARRRAPIRRRRRWRRAAARRIAVHARKGDINGSKVIRARVVGLTKWLYAGELDAHQGKVFLEMIVEAEGFVATQRLRVKMMLSVKGELPSRRHQSTYYLARHRRPNCILSRSF